LARDAPPGFDDACEVKALRRREAPHRQGGAAAEKVLAQMCGESRCRRGASQRTSIAHWRTSSALPGALGTSTASEASTDVGSSRVLCRTAGAAAMRRSAAQPST
jgi:hypothetical protein